MPETDQAPDRDAWLARVATSLDLPEPMAADILEELAAHLDDTADAFRDAGLAPADASRRAIRGMGDPAALGRDLGRARRHGRFLLAAVGGAFRATITFGIWAWVVLWLGAASVGLIGMLISSAILHAVGSSTSSYFSGPAGSLATVAVSVAWFAWLGRVLPSRVAASAHRSVRGVRVVLGVAGLIVGSEVLWLTVNLSMDPVLAVGLPLGPVAFLVAALRAPNDPSLNFLHRLPARAALLAVALVATVALALATVTPSESHGWEANTAAIGRPAEEFAVLASQSRPWSAWPYTGSVVFDDDAAATAIAAQFPVVRAEIWPTTITDGHVHFGAAPVAVQEAPLTTTIQLDLRLPVYRTPITVSAFIVAVAPDGTRAILAEAIAQQTTNIWHGTLADWWFGAQ